RMAATQGLAAAQFNLGVMYHKGEAVAQNDVNAKAWISKAADQNYAPAKEALAKLFPSQPSAQVDDATLPGGIPPQECDRLASNPTDARRVNGLPGVQFKELRDHLDAALTACAA